MAYKDQNLMGDWLCHGPLAEDISTCNIPENSGLNLTRKKLICYSQNYWIVIRSTYFTS